MLSPLENLSVSPSLSGSSRVGTTSSGLRPANGWPFSNEYLTASLMAAWTSAMFSLPSGVSLSMSRVME